MSPRLPPSGPAPLSPPFLTSETNGLKLRLHVIPGASASAIAGCRADGGGQWRLEVRVTAPADRGRANAAVIDLLSDAWRVPKSTLSICAGASGRRKTLAIAAPTPELMQRLGAIRPPAPALCENRRAGR